MFNRRKYAMWSKNVKTLVNIGRWSSFRKQFEVGEVKPLQHPKLADCVRFQMFNDDISVYSS